MGVTILESKNILLQNNNLFTFVRFGILIQTSNNITIDSNILIGVRDRGLVTLDEFVDVSGGLIACGVDPMD